MSLPVIELKNIWFRYNEHPVLHDINLTIYEKEFFAIIGPNGGGKTTLLKIILGLFEARGEIKVFGQKPGQIRGQLGYVPQHSHIEHGFPISVFETVLLGRLKHKSFLRKYAKNDISIAKRALDLVKMSDYDTRQINELSCGQFQRILIARALASEPKVLLLDEPTASLDQQIQETIYELLQELNKEITIVLVTHDIGVISSYIKRIACLNHKLYVHEKGKLEPEHIAKVYGCPFEFLAHGTPHRVLGQHDKENET